MSNGPTATRSTKLSLYDSEPVTLTGTLDSFVGLLVGPGPHSLGDGEHLSIWLRPDENTPIYKEFKLHPDGTYEGADSDAEALQIIAKRLARGVEGAR